MSLLGRLKKLEAQTGAADNCGIRDAEIDGVPSTEIVKSSVEQF